MLKITEEKKRKKAIREATGNLGFIIETEDKIICYIKKENCHYERYPCYQKEYVINLGDYKKRYKELVEEYGLDKEIVYVLDGLTFRGNEAIKIYGAKNIELEIKNCEFGGELHIDYFRKCTIKNTNIRNREERGFFIDSMDLEINGVNIGENKNLADNVRIYANNSIKIINSKIIANDCFIGFCDTNQINIENSTFEVKKDIEIESTKLYTKSSSIISSISTWISTKDFNYLSGLIINALYIYTNREKFVNENSKTPIFLKSLTDLDEKRKILLRQLKEFNDKIIKKREEKLSLVESNYNEQSVGKVLRREKNNSSSKR